MSSSAEYMYEEDFDKLVEIHKYQYIFSKDNADIIINTLNEYK